jgi:hypothetical protein
VERSFQEATKIELAAGAIAEGLCDRYKDKRDPSDVARSALEAYRELNLTNPRPLYGDERPLVN